ncbi:MAG: hypothetical protein Q9170_005446 [Blastenia crenularia]
MGGGPHIKPPLRIAILECDTGLPKALVKYKRYGAISSALLEAGAKAAGLEDGRLEVSMWDVVNEAGRFPRLEDVDGVFLTGSKFDSFADTPWTNKLVDFVKSILSQDRVKLVGVCFGHQIIGRAMGAKVGRNEDQGWEVSITDVDLTEQGKKVFEGKDVLGHPEFTEEILVEILEVRHEQGVFGDEMYGDAMARVGRKHDGVMVGKRFIEFLLDR